VRTHAKLSNGAICENYHEAHDHREAADALTIELSEKLS
jgi:hypothetical protein